MLTNIKYNGNIFPREYEIYPSNNKYRESISILGQCNYHKHIEKRLFFENSIARSKN